jgi:hypothetical protein
MESKTVIPTEAGPSETEGPAQWRDLLFRDYKSKLQKHERTLYNATAFVASTNCSSGVAGSAPISAAYR